MDEIIRAVDGVNDPPEFFIAARGLFEEFSIRAFFAYKTVVREMLFDMVNDYLLTEGVGLRNKFIVIFYRDRARIDILQCLPAGKPGGSHRNVEYFLHIVLFGDHLKAFPKYRITHYFLTG
jgi:hypothetical protein